MATETQQQQQGLERLAMLMNKRRLELGKRWEDVAADGDISIKTLRDIRTGRGGMPRELTLGKINIGLRWKPGSAESIIGGGEPEPLPPEPPAAGALIRAARLSHKISIPYAASQSAAAGTPVTPERWEAIERGEIQGSTAEIGMMAAVSGADAAKLEAAGRADAAAALREVMSHPPQGQEDGSVAALEAWLERISRLPEDAYNREIGRVLRRAQEMRGDREAG